ATAGSCFSPAPCLAASVARMSAGHVHVSSTDLHVRFSSDVEVFRMRRQTSTLLLGILLLLLGAACGANSANRSSTAPAAATTSARTVSPTPRTLTKVTFMAGYQPQANLPFVAAYVAKAKGFFAQQGLDVEIQHSSGNDEHLLLLSQNRIQFTTADGSSILKRVASPGIPLLSIALFGQRGESAFAVLADSGINSPKDWEGKTVGYKVFPTPEYLALLKKTGVDRVKIKEVSVGFDPNVLASRQVDVLPVFRSNEPDLLEREGHPVKLFDPADYGVPALGLNFVTLRPYAQDHPEVVTAFLKATMQAVQYAQDHPDEAIQDVLTYAPKAVVPHQAFMLQTELKNAQTDLTRQNGIGWMTAEQWQTFEDSLLTNGGLDKKVDVNQVFTTQFLTQVYDHGRLRP
ncbi:MAG: ABC transporter substrate-binding protein, partial [Dehalococcoidia bacterium]